MIDVFFHLLGMVVFFGAIGFAVGFTLIYYKFPALLRAHAHHLNVIGGWLWSDWQAQSDHVERMQAMRRKSQTERRRVRTQIHEDLWSGYTKL